MFEIINIYCDESCHLEHDNLQSMVLGALWCPKTKAKIYNNEIAEIKKKHNLSRFFEIKWTKVSNSKINFYEELIDFFFSKEDLGFRSLVIPDKKIINHDYHSQTHDDWYYKMYFFLLKNIIYPEQIYNIYLDIKDTRSREKLQKLHQVLSNVNYDFDRNIIHQMQHVHSHDIGLLQIADLLIGALSYHFRGLRTNSAKLELINRISQISGLSLNRSTLPTENKFNLFIWRPVNGEI